MAIIYGKTVREPDHIISDYLDVRDRRELLNEEVRHILLGGGTLSVNHQVRRDRLDEEESSLKSEANDYKQAHQQNGSTSQQNLNNFKQRLNSLMADPRAGLFSAIATLFGEAYHAAVLQPAHTRRYGDVAPIKAPSRGEVRTVNRANARFKIHGLN